MVLNLFLLLSFFAFSIVACIFSFYLTVFGLISCQHFHMWEVRFPVMDSFLLIKNFIFSVFSGSGKHTIFGRVCRGMEIVKRLGSVQTDSTDRFVFLTIFLKILLIIILLPLVKE